MSRDRNELLINAATLSLSLLTLAGCGVDVNIPSLGKAFPPNRSSAPVPSPRTTSVSASPTPNPGAVATPAQAKAIALNNQGAQKLQAQDYAGAIKDFTSAIQQDPKLAQAYLGRGIVYSVQGNRAAAMKDYDRAIQLQPTLANAYLNRAEDHTAAGKTSAAIADLNKAAALFQEQGNSTSMNTVRVRLAQLQAPIIEPAPMVQPAQPPAISPPLARSASQDARILLAQHLWNKNAQFYSAYWCSACQYQLQLFGTEAEALVNKVECDPRGQNSQRELCQQKGIRAYPTWEIDGNLYVGAISLDELASLSGYTGSRQF